MYVEHTVYVLREIRRVLRRDGVVWWNLGDTFFGSWGNYGSRQRATAVAHTRSAFPGRRGMASPIGHR